MSNRLLAPLLTTAAQYRPGAVPDAVLLARFADQRDDAAFELLVWRYRDLVAAICRRVLGHAQDAEDATQATFLVLAKRAGSLCNHPALAGWLARVAYRCAGRVRRSRPRPTTVLPEVPELPQSPERAELVAALDAEIDRLPMKYRVPFVLCYLQGKTYPEAAAELGCPVGTLSGWLTRGKALLRRRLIRRGFGAAVVIGPNIFIEILVVGSDPGRAVAAIARAASAYSRHATATGPAAVIATGVLRTMTLLRFATASAIAGLVVASVVGTLAFAHNFPADPPAPSAPAAAKADPKPRTDLDRFQGEWAFESATRPDGEDAIPSVWDSRMTFTNKSVSLTNYAVPYSAQPLVVPELKSTFTIDATKATKEFDLAVPELAAKIFGFDNDGGSIRGIYKFEDENTLTMCLANRPPDPRPTDLSVDVKLGNRFVYTLKRNPNPGAPTPKQARVKVVDADGKPVVGARLAYWHPAEVMGRELTTWDAPTTSPDGIATVEVASFTRGSLYVGFLGQSKRLAGFATVTPASMLATSTYTVTVQPACLITGRLACPDLPKTVAGIGWTNVTIAHGHHAFTSSQASRGTFTFVAPPGKYTLHASGTYLASDRREIEVKPGQTDLRVPDITLAPNAFGKTLGLPAPALKEVKGWKGEPTTLAELKGKPVLVMFWVGYDANVENYASDWFADLHAVDKKYKDRGLEVIVVAIDRDGNIDTPEKFEAKIKEIAPKATRKPAKFTFPFRVALTFHDKRYGGANGLVVGSESMTDYGVNFPVFPVLIDREGKVVGQVFPRSSPKDLEIFEAVVGSK